MIGKMIVNDSSHWRIMWSNQRALVGGLTITKNSWNIEFFMDGCSEHGLKLSNLILEMAVEVGRMMMHWILDPASGAHHSLARKITPRPKTNTLCLSVWNPSQDDVLTQASWPTAKKQWCCRRLVSMGTSMKQWTNSNHPLPNISPHIATWKFHYFCCDNE